MKSLFCELSLKGVLAIVVLALLLPAPKAHAIAMIDLVILDQAPTVADPSDGTVAYAGGLTPLVGSGIDVNLIIGSGTAANAGTHLCVSCTLSFVTGNRLVLPGRIFAGGGLIVVTGLVPAAGILAPDVLLAGAFNGAVTVDLNPLPGMLTGFTVASFLDIVNPGLTGFFGMPDPPPLYFGSLFIGISGVEDPGPGAAFVAEILGTGVITTQAPEPGTVLLLGLGLLALTGRKKLLSGPARRKFSS